MTPGLLSGILGLGKSLIGLADQVIVDKDKRIEFQYKVMDRTFEFYEKVLNTPTVPWVDALIKFILAFKEFLRPLGSALLTGVVVYMRMNGQELPPWIEAPLASAFPGWMYSRHREKQQT